MKLHFYVRSESVDVGGKLRLVVRDFVAEKWGTATPIKSLDQISKPGSNAPRNDVEAESKSSENGLSNFQFLVAAANFNSQTYE